MDPQQKTAAPAVAGYIPEYSETPHSGSFDIAQHGLSSDDVARLTAEGNTEAQKEIEAKKQKAPSKAERKAAQKAAGKQAKEEIYLQICRQTHFDVFER